MKGKRSFKNKQELCALVENYFKYIEGEYQVEKKPAKRAGDAPEEHRIPVREAEPATLLALVFHLGFNSRDDFEALESKGRYSAILKRARLRVEAAYEKRLLQASPTGAMFALKNMGWNEKTDTVNTPTNIATKLTIKLIETGLRPASSEKDVLLD